MDFSAHCISVHEQRENVSLTGFISHPEFTRSNSKNIFLFVNKRFIRDNSITHAVLSAYRQVIPARRYPAAVLFIDLPAADVDVNVHPAKMEVRFKDSRGIYELVSQTIAQALAGAGNVKGSFVYRLEAREKTSIGGITRWPGKIQEKSAGLFSRQNLQKAIDNDLLARSVAEKITSTESDGAAAKEPITFTSFRYLGQFFNTYLVFASDEGLLLVDQHAAHERIILERLKKAEGQKIISQQLLMPEVVSLNPAQVALFSGYIAFLRQIGLEIEIFGRDAIVIKALPAILSSIQPKELVYDIADQLGDQDRASSLQEKKEKIFAALACKVAIKANSPLSSAEVEALCRDLEATPFNLTCPHGRPISIKFSLSEIERMFKRK
jgi:DNA mismatch repair protein MutL